ncbi:hypothetical protein HMI55_002043 [Coelomomyces lativittatus]|nr:hypothetical protein HMI55_002043 [Coelomomyces lativittatus]
MVYLGKLKTINGFVKGHEVDIQRIFKFFLNFLMKSNNNILRKSCACETLSQEQVKSLFFNYFLPEIHQQVTQAPENTILNIDSNKKERIEYLTSLKLKPPEVIVEFKATSPSVVEIIETYLDDLLETDILEYNNLLQGSELTNENIKKFLSLSFSKGQIQRKNGRYLFHKEWEVLFRKYFPNIKKARKLLMNGVPEN